MRVIPGNPREFANETPTSHHFGKFAISQPEIMSQTATLFKGQGATFTAFLAAKGFVVSDITKKAGGVGYKQVGNRKIMWKVRGLDDRKGTFMADAVCEQYPDMPGYKQSVITLYLDTNWFSPKDVLELGDNRTQVWVADENLPEQQEDGSWEYHVKMMTNDNDDYIQSELLEQDMEIGVLHTAFEEMSETAYEKYTFHEWAHTYTTIQRLKWSISGTASQMTANAVWTEHNGQKTWMQNAQYQMLKRWAKYRENQTIFGKGTVTANDEIILRSMQGHEVMAGDGFMEQGDGPFKMQYEDLNIRVIDRMLENLALYSGSDGHKEVAVLCGRQFATNFSRIMKQEAGLDPRVVVMDGKEKGINNDYSFYEHAGIRFTPLVHDWFDDQSRPQSYSADGTRNESNRAIFVSVGNADANQPNVELLALGNRAWKEGTVRGIDKGGDISNSVDGSHTHGISETGVALMDINSVGELYRPYRSR